LLLLVAPSFSAKVKKVSVSIGNADTFGDLGVRDSDRPLEFVTLHTEWLMLRFMRFKKPNLSDDGHYQKISTVISIL